MKRSRIRSKSTRRRLEDGPRRKLNKELEDSPRACQLGPLWRAASIRLGRPELDRCTGRATCWHERRKRSSTGSILKRENLMASCSSCNGLVEDEADVARDLELVCREGDEDWDRLGR